MTAFSLRNFASYFANFAVWILFYRKGRKGPAKDRKSKLTHCPERKELGSEQ
jgi:hypothetical protein